MQSLNDMRRTPSVTWQERAHSERTRSIGRRSRKAIRESASLQGSASHEHSPDSSLRNILTPYLSNGRDASIVHGGLPQEPGLMHSHADAVISFIRDGMGSTVLHSTAIQDLQPRDSPEGSGPSLSGSRDAAGLQCTAPQQLTRNGSADAREAPTSPVTRIIDNTESLRPASGNADDWRPTSDGSPADSSIATRPVEAEVMSDSQRLQPQLKASQPPIHDAALTTASFYSADESPETGAVPTGTLDRSSSDATHRLSNAEAAEETQLLEADDMPDLSGLWADAGDLESQRSQRDELRSSKAAEKAQVLQLYGELKAIEETACLQNVPCLNELSRTKMVKEAKSSQRDDSADISGHAEDLIPALFWEAQEAHISAMHAELDSSLAECVDTEIWASEASTAPTEIAHAQLDGKEEQGDGSVSQSLDTAIPDNLQQTGRLGSSREDLLSIAAAIPAATPAAMSSLPCASPSAILPDITLQATAMEVPCTEARDSLMPVHELCRLAPVSQTAAQEDPAAVSSSQKGLQRGKGQKQRTGRSAKKGCSTRPVIRFRARGQGPAKAAGRDTDKAGILAAILALQMAVSEQAASIAQLKEEVLMRSSQTSVGCSF